MSRRKDKQLRRSVRKEVGDNSSRFLTAMLSEKFSKRLAWAFVILFRIGYEDLILGLEHQYTGEDDGIKRETAS